MKKKYLLVVLFGVAGVMASGSVQAATVNIFEETGNIETVDSISTWETTGMHMTGMEVIVNYGDGSSEATSWDLYGAGTGAVGTDWSLTMVDPTLTTYYQGIWSLDTTNEKGISSIILNGFDHNVVFDDDADNYPGTPGSAWGNPLETGVYSTSTSYTGDINVLYFGAVAITGSDPFGDLYQSMAISFADNPFSATDTLTYYQDTDNLVSPVPEPATMFLFGLGVAGLVGTQVRRRKKD